MKLDASLLRPGELENAHRLPPVEIGHPLGTVLLAEEDVFEGVRFV